jgi:hypothetical protein
MRPDAPYFIILLCLTPDDFTCQGKSAALNGLNLFNFILAVLNAVFLMCRTFY